MNDVIEMAGSDARMTAQSPRSAVATTTPSDLLRIAVEQGADMEKLEKLMDLQERWEANQARKAYVEAMAEFKMNPPEIFKTKKVEHSGISYMHASIGDVTGSIIEGLAKNGFSHRWNTEQRDGGQIVVTCILTHKLGHSESTSLNSSRDDSGKKNNIQSIASAITYLQRYTLLAATGLATKDLEDDDGAGAEPKEKTVARSIITGKAFEKALASIRKGDYSAAEIEKYYDLTPDQKTAVADAEKEKK